MSDLALLLALGAGVMWFAVAAHYPRLAVWLLLLWIPVQGWFQLNVFNHSSGAVLIYAFQILGIYLIFAARALESPDRFGPPSIIRFAVPFVAWALLLVPYTSRRTGSS